MIANRKDRLVVLIAHVSQRQEVRRWLAEFPDDRVVVLSADEASEWKLDGKRTRHISARSMYHVAREVRLMGAVDVVVSLLPANMLPEGVTDHLQMWTRLFRFVRAQGTYVIDRSTTALTSSSVGLAGLLEVLAAADEPAAVKALDPPSRELARSTGTFLMSRDLILITKRLKHLVKVRDAEANRFLPSREPSLTVVELDSLRPGRLESRATVTSHQAAVEIEALTRTLLYPELHLRHYTGKIAFSGSTLMWSGHTIFPDSFRWHLTERADNPSLKAGSKLFARVDSEHIPQEVLKGNYYQLDSAYSGHFGHITTEVLSRLWGWDVAKKEIPDLKVVFRSRAREFLAPHLQLGLFKAYGIAESDIVWVNKPVWLESVVSASPMWHNAEPHYVHPGMAEVWARLREGLLDGRPVGEHRKIFVSRGAGAKHRPCRNTPEVEDYFRERGFHIVYPEDLELGEQAAVFAGAEVIAGFGGSAMFNMMYAKNLKSVILLSHEAYTARNEHLYTSVLGADVHYFWSSPDLAHPEDDWTDEAF
ncbi:MAG: glycosyltransferase family 61 protein, partial [Nocardioidaceae bacterium]